MPTLQWRAECDSDGSPYASIVSKQRHHRTVPSSRSLSLDELARRYDLKPLHDSEELAVDIWESDEELDAFLADVRASRDASLS